VSTTGDYKISDAKRMNNSSVTSNHIKYMYLSTQDKIKRTSRGPQAWPWPEIT